MLRYSTPGAYYERTDAGAPAVSPVRMDVAAFVGIAARGPVHTAVPIDSWRQFAAYFGDVTGAGYLAYAVRAFFENGGRRCWVVRLTSDAAMAASTTLLAVGGVAAWRVSASSVGVWGNDLTLQLQGARRAQTITVPSLSAPEYQRVASVTGFERGTHVRVVFPDGTVTFRVVSKVEADTSRLYWVNPAPALRLPYDTPLVPPDPDAPLILESIEFGLLVRQLGRLVAVYDRLSLIPEHPRYGPAVLPPFTIDPRQPSTWTIAASPEPIVIEELRSAATIAALAPLDTTGPSIGPLSAGLRGADGLAGLTVDDFIGEPSDPLASDEVRERARRGLRALDDVGEVAAVAVPDIHIHPLLPPERAPLPPCVPDPCLPAPPPGPAPAPLPSIGDLPPIFDDRAVFRVQNELVLHCERHADRLALLDPPFSTISDVRLGLTAIEAWRKQFDSKYAVLYYPWLRVVDPIPGGERLTRDIPPSGHVRSSGYRTSRRRSTRPATATSTTRTSTRFVRCPAAACASWARACCRATPTGATSTSADC